MLIRILYHYFKTRYFQKRIRNKAQLERHQKKQFQRLIKTTLKYSRFYQPYLNQPLKDWPVIDKQIMMAHFNEINTKNIKVQEAMDLALKAEQTRDFSPMIGDISVGLSSGTSGSRGLFLTSPKERDAWVGAILAKVMPNGLFSKEKIAFFLRANNPLYTTLNKSKTIQFHFFDLCENFNTHLQTLNRLQPSIISAPASVLTQLLAEKSKLHLSLKQIISVAEVLDKIEEKKLTKAFGCPVLQIYQCTEGFLGVSDKHTSEITLNENNLIIEKEWLDEHRFIPIITDLQRHTQPIIRYRLDDVLVMKSGAYLYTVLSRIEGRLGDICYGVNEEKRIPIFSDVLCQRISSSGIDFYDYVICQKELNHFTIQMIPEPHDKTGLIEHLNQLFLQLKCNIPKWSWVPFENKPLTKKRRRVICLLERSNALFSCNKNNISSTLDK